MFDLHNNIKVLGDKVARVADNTAQVVTVDRAGFLAVEALIAVGDIADADATLAVLVEDSNDNSTFTAVADDFLIGTEAGAGFVNTDDNKTAKIGYAGKKRYVRVTVTPANNTGNVDIAIVVVGGHPLNAPQTAQLV